VGRNVGSKTGLVDVATAQSILGKSRRTIFYLAKLGKLSPRHVEGSTKTWFEAKEVVGLTQVRFPLRCPKVNIRLEQHLRRFHPYLFAPSSA
jgi:hypothetical protein